MKIVEVHASRGTLINKFTSLFVSSDLAYTTDGVQVILNKFAHKEPVRVLGQAGTPDSEAEWVYYLVITPVGVRNMERTIKSPFSIAIKPKTLTKEQWEKDIKTMLNLVKIFYDKGEGRKYPRIVLDGPFECVKKQDDNGLGYSDRLTDAVHGSAAGSLAEMDTTEYLLSSPANLQHLSESIQQLHEGKTKEVKITNPPVKDTEVDKESPTFKRLLSLAMLGTYGG